jgi:hypothetical protein
MALLPSFRTRKSNSVVCVVSGEEEGEGDVRTKEFMAETSTVTRVVAEVELLVICGHGGGGREVAEGTRGTRQAVGVGEGGAGGVARRGVTGLLLWISHSLQILCSFCQRLSQKLWYLTSMD